jgi:hypothetical protein
LENEVLHLYIPRDYYFWDDFYSFFLQNFFNQYFWRNKIDPMPLRYTCRKVLSHGIYIWNMKALSLKILPFISKFLQTIQTNGKAKNYMPPIFQYAFYGGWGHRKDITNRNCLCHTNDLWTIIMQNWKHLHHLINISEQITFSYVHHQ